MDSEEDEIVKEGTCADSREESPLVMSTGELQDSGPVEQTEEGNHL